MHLLDASGITCLMGEIPDQVRDDAIVLPGLPPLVLPGLPPFVMPGLAPFVMPGLTRHLVRDGGNRHAGLCAIAGLIMFAMLKRINAATR